MLPWVVFAWKFGAIEPSRRRDCSAGGVAQLRKGGVGYVQVLEVAVSARREQMLKESSERPAVALCRRSSRSNRTRGDGA